MQFVPGRPNSMPVTIHFKKRGTRRRAPTSDKQTTESASTEIVTPYRRARLSLNLESKGESVVEDLEHSDTISGNKFYVLVNKKSPQIENEEIIQTRIQKSANINAMNRSFGREQLSPIRHCLGQAPSEPILERSLPLCSSSSSTSSARLMPLAGSLSCVNLARLTPISSPILVANSCSSTTLDQLHSTEPTQLFEHLFLGSQKDALDTNLLQRNGITNVINLSENCPRPASFSDNSKRFLRIPVNDTYSAKLLPHFEIVFNFIEEARKHGGRVLIHCLAGISRSPTMAIAYVMRSKRIGNEEAYSFVKSRRPTISPNFNFLGQLWEYERQLRQQHILPQLSYSEDPTIFIDSEMTSKNDPTSSIKTNESIIHDHPELKEDPFSSSKNNPQLQRPRQLLCSLNSRQSCPPTLMTNVFPLTKEKDIPSPSTEFSRLDISLVNPCFGIDEQHHKMCNTSLMCSRNGKPPTIAAENPIFGKLMNSADFRGIMAKNGMGESVGSSSSGFSSASDSRLCSTESIYSSFSINDNDSFSSSTDEFGLPTRNCLADSEGDELVRFGPTGNQPMGELEKEESNPRLRADVANHKKWQKRTCNRQQELFEMKQPFIAALQRGRHCIADKNQFCHNPLMRCTAKERKPLVDQKSQMQRNLFKTSFCLDRLAAFGRKRNTNGTQFRQSLPTIGDDINQEEEEEGNKERTPGMEMEEQRANATEKKDAKRFVEPDQASISSASSMEIAVQ